MFCLGNPDRRTVWGGGGYRLRGQISAKHAQPNTFRTIKCARERKGKEEMQCVFACVWTAFFFIFPPRLDTVAAMCWGGFFFWCVCKRREGEKIRWFATRKGGGGSRDTGNKQQEEEEASNTKRTPSKESCMRRRDGRWGWVEKGRIISQEREREVSAPHLAGADPFRERVGVCGGWKEAGGGGGMRG